MPKSELDHQLKSILDKGFNEGFVRRCAEKFETHSFHSESMASARLYLFYLISVMKVITSETPQWESLIAEAEGDEISDDIAGQSVKLLDGMEQTLQNVALSIGCLSYLYIIRNKKSGEDFLTLFVLSWFEYFGKY